MSIDEFETKYPKAASALIIKAGGKGNVASILPDSDDHCEWSALCQGPKGRDRVAIYVKATHPSLEESNGLGSSWMWEDDL